MRVISDVYFDVAVILSKINNWHQPLVSYLQLGYVLIDRTPPDITEYKAWQHGLAFIYLLFIFSGKPKNNLGKKTFLSRHSSDGSLTRMSFIIQTFLIEKSFLIENIIFDRKWHFLSKRYFRSNRLVRVSKDRKSCIACFLQNWKIQETDLNKTVKKE